MPTWAFKGNFKGKGSAVSSYPKVETDGTRRRWTRDEDRRCADYRRAGLKVFAIARRLGRTPEAVEWRLRKLGVRFRRTPAQMTELRRDVSELVRQGFCDYQIVKLLKLPRPTVQHARVTAGLKSGRHYA